MKGRWKISRCFFKILVTYQRENTADDSLVGEEKDQHCFRFMLWPETAKIISLETYTLTSHEALHRESQRVYAAMYGKTTGRKPLVEKTTEEAESASLRQSRSLNRIHGGSHLPHFHHESPSLRG